MKNAFVYFYEFVDTDSVYITFLENSIKLILKYSNIKSQDIFILYVGVSVDIKNKLKKLSQNYNVNIVDISDGLDHYYNFLWIQNDINIKNKHVRFYKHKFSFYQDIMSYGYDNIIHLDADLLCYENINYMFSNLLSNTIYTMHIPDSIPPTEEYVRNILEERKENTIPLFSFNKEDGPRYIHLKNVIKLILDYNLDNFISDISKIDYWPSGGMYFFSRDIIDNYYSKLSLINYLITKDDEIAILLLACAYNISLKSLDIKNVSCFEYSTFFANRDKYTILHPAGVTEKNNLLNSGIKLFS